MNKFGISELKKCMCETAGRFLLECIMRRENRVVNTLDELWYSRYHSHKLKFDLERFPCISRSIRLHKEHTTNVGYGLSLKKNV